MLVYTDVDPEHEEAFNRWYDEIHVPDIIAVEGFSAARRYKLSGPAPRGHEPVSRYLALYEMDTDDTRAAMQKLGEAVGGLREAGRMFEQMKVGSSATYVAVADRQLQADRREYEKDGVKHRVFELRAETIGKLDRAVRKQNGDPEPDAE